MFLLLFSQSDAFQPVRYIRASAIRVILRLAAANRKALEYRRASQQAFNVPLAVRLTALSDVYRSCAPARRSRPTQRTAPGCPSRSWHGTSQCMPPSTAPGQTFFFAQAATLPSLCAASAPWMDKPEATAAPLQIFLSSRSLPPMPLPSLVQKGTIFFPVRS